MARNSPGATVRDEMVTAVQANPTAPTNVWQGRVVGTSAKEAKTECLFADGTSILISNFLASFLRTVDEILFPLDVQTADAGTEIYIRHNPEEKR